MRLCYKQVVINVYLLYIKQIYAYIYFFKTIYVILQIILLIQFNTFIHSNKRLIKYARLNLIRLKTIFYIALFNSVIIRSNQIYQKNTLFFASRCEITSVNPIIKFFTFL